MQNQAKAIRESLEQAGLPSDIDWSRLLLAITQIARVAQTKANIDKPLYAAEAAKQARHLAKAMSSAVTGYETLSGEMQGLVASYLGLVHDELPLLRDSLLPSERPVLRKLSSATRLLLFLRSIARAADLVAAPLEAAGKVVPLSSPLPARLPASVRATVTRAVRSEHRPFDGRFPHTGAPREEAVRWAVPRLWGLYREVTGKQPTIYPNSHDGALDGYGGKFYPFVKAALKPLRLIPAGSLSNAIYVAYKDHRAALVSDPTTEANRRTPAR